MKYSAAVTIIALLATFSPALAKTNKGGKKGGNKGGPSKPKSVPVGNFWVRLGYKKVENKYLVQTPTRQYAADQQVKPNLITTQTNKKVTQGMQQNGVREIVKPNNNTIIKTEVITENANVPNNKQLNKDPSPKNSCTDCATREDCVINYKGEFIRCGGVTSGLKCTKKAFGNTCWTREEPSAPIKSKAVAPTVKDQSPPAEPTRSDVSPSTQPMKPSPKKSCADCAEKEDCVTNFKGDFIQCGRGGLNLTSGFLLCTKKAFGNRCRWREKPSAPIKSKAAAPTVKDQSPPVEPTRSAVSPSIQPTDEYDPIHLEDEDIELTATSNSTLDTYSEPTSDAYLETISEAPETAPTTSIPTVQASAEPYIEPYVEPYADMADTNKEPTVELQSDEGTVYSGGLKLTFSALFWLATLLTI
jgi:hypothetical protein